MAGLTVLAAAAPAAAPHLAGGGTLDVSLLRIVSALFLCLLLAAVAAILLKRGGGRIGPAGSFPWRRAVPARRIDVVESRRISPHADLCLVRCDGEAFLILSSASQQQVLHRWPAADDAR